MSNLDSLKLKKSNARLVDQSGIARVGLTGMTHVNRIIEFIYSKRTRTLHQMVKIVVVEG